MNRYFYLNPITPDISPENMGEGVEVTTDDDMKYQITKTFLKAFILVF